MVSDVNISPTGITRRSSSDVPTIRISDTQSRDVRGAGTVSPTGYRAQEDAYTFISRQNEASARDLSGLAAGFQKSIDEQRAGEDQAMFADVKAKAIRRGAELASQNPFNLDAFDSTFDAYANEVLGTVPDRIRSDLELELYSIATNKRNGILSRKEQLRVDNIRLAQVEAYEESIDEVVNTIGSEKDYVGAGIRKQQLEDQIKASLMTASQKEAALDKLQGHTRDKVMFTRSKELFEQGRYNEIIPEMAALLDGPLGSDLNDVERAQKASESFQYIEKLERIESKREAEADKLEGKQRDDNYASLVQSLIDSRSGVNTTPPTVTQVAATNLDPDKKLALFKIVNGGDSDFDDPDVIREVRETRRTNPAAASQALTDAQLAGQISNATYLREEASLYEQAKRGGSLPPEQRAVEKLNATVSDSLLSDYPLIGVAAQSATAELNARIQEYDASQDGANPMGRSQFIDAETRNVIKEFIAPGVAQLKTTLKLPYQFSGGRNDVTPERLTKSRAQIQRDFDEGSLTEGRYYRELDALENWESVLEAEENANGQ